MPAIDDEIVFAWAIGKALLVVIVSLCILVYAAWVGTRRMLPDNQNQKFRSDAGR